MVFGDVGFSLGVRALSRRDVDDSQTIGRYMRFKDTENSSVCVLL